MRLPDPALVAHQPRIAGRSAQLPGFCLLLPRPFERAEVGVLRPRRIPLQQKQPALDAERFGIIEALLPAWPLDLRGDLVDQFERSLEIAELGGAAPLPSANADLA